MSLSKYQFWITGVVLVCILLAFSVFAAVDFHASRTRTKSEIERIVSIFRKYDSTDDYLSSVIDRLDGAASSEVALDILAGFLTTYYRADRRNHDVNLWMRQQPLVALGRMRTRASVDVVRRFDNWAKRIQRNPPDFQFGWKEMPFSDFAPYLLKPLATCTDEKGIEWALIYWARLAKQGDYWLTQVKSDNRWSTPILLSIVDLPERPYYLHSGRQHQREFALKARARSFTVQVDSHYIEFSLADQFVDSDKDGLTDNFEHRIQTSMNHPDTDGDGINDGEDSNPLTPKHSVVNKFVEIRQAVFTILFATSNSRYVLFIGRKGGIAEQEYYGYSGLVLPTTQQLRWFGIKEIEVEMDARTTATVVVKAASSAYEAVVKKMYGKWVVIDFRILSIA